MSAVLFLLLSAHFSTSIALILEHLRYIEFSPFSHSIEPKVALYTLEIPFPPSGAFLAGFET